MRLIEFEMAEDQLRKLVELIIEDYLHSLNLYNSHYVAVESVQDRTIDRICKHAYAELDDARASMH